MLRMLSAKADGAGAHSNQGSTLGGDSASHSPTSRPCRQHPCNTCRGVLRSHMIWYGQRGLALSSEVCANSTRRPMHCTHLPHPHHRNHLLGKLGSGVCKRTQGLQKKVCSPQQSHHPKLHTPATEIVPQHTVPTTCCGIQDKSRRLETRCRPCTQQQPC